MTGVERQRMQKSLNPKIQSKEYLQLAPQWIWGLPSFLDITLFRLVTDVSGQPLTPIFKGNSIQEDGTDMLSWNVGTKLPTYTA